MWELYHKEGWVPKNWCFWIVVLEKTLESPLDSKEIKPINPNGKTMHIHWMDWCWSWVTWCEKLTRWENPWCWERLKSGEEGDRGWDGWMALSTQWTWVWANSKRQWMTGKPGVLQSMGLQRVRRDLVIEQQHTQWLTDFLFLMQWVWIRQSGTSLEVLQCHQAHRLSPLPEFEIWALVHMFARWLSPLGILSAF